MAKLIVSSSNKCIHYDESKEFSHGMWSVANSILIYTPNRNPDDFGFLYYVDGGYLKPSGSCIYEFDYYCIYNEYRSSLQYLCDDHGNQYTFGTGATYKSYNNSGSYRSIDSEKLIHDYNYLVLSLNPTSNKIYNNHGNWYGNNPQTQIGGGFNITYYPSSHDNIYVYLTNGPLKTSYFTLYDMTNPDVLAGNATGNPSGALYNNILHAYDMGDCYNYRDNSDGSVNITIIFNNIGKDLDSNTYSLFYGTNTWIYIYSSAGNFRRKKALVQKYNDDYPTTPYEVTYTFDHNDDNIGFNIIGFPLFEWRSTGSRGYLVNYYDILISDDVSLAAMVTINFDETCKTVSINGNVCNSGDVNYYRVGTVLDFVVTPIDDYVNAAWYSEWRVNKLKENTSYTYSSDVNKPDKFSLLVDTADTITVNAYITIIVD